MPYSDELYKEVTSLKDGNSFKVYQLDGAGYDGVNPVYTNVTDDVAKRLQPNMGSLENVTTQAGKEGVGGEYTAINSIGSSNNFKRVWQFKEYIRDIELQSREFI